MTSGEIICTGGGAHPDKSVGIHLSGLHLVLERGVRPPEVPRRLQRMAAAIGQHIEIARRWAESVWGTWSPHHAKVAALVSRHLGRGRAD